MDAGVVDQDLDRASGEEFRQRRRGRLAFGDVENDRFGTAAAGENFADDRLGLGAAAVGVHDHVAAVGGQAAADRRADAAATARNQRPLHCRPCTLTVAASRTTAARPSTRQRPAWLTEKW